MRIVVYFDRVIRKENKIHYADCPQYLGRKRHTTTTYWMGPYSTMQVAIQETRVNRLAQCCVDKR